MAFLPGTGRHRVQIAHFFRGPIGSWRSLGVGLVVGSRLYRIRRRCGSLVLPKALKANNAKKLLFLCGLLREIDQK